MSLLRNIKTTILWCLYLPIVGGTFLVVWLDRKLKFTLPFPRDVEELKQKQEWCINRLKQRGILPANAVVNDYHVTALNQDMIFRSNAGIIRIEYSLNGASKTRQLFAKFAPNVGSVWNRTIFNLQLNHIKEIDFNNLFVKTDRQVPSPEVYVAEMSVLTGNLCLITEYMGDCIEHKDSIYKDFTPEHLELVLQNMATLHARFWNCTEERMKKVLPIDDNTVYLFDSMVAFSWSKAARKILVQSWQQMNRQQTIVHGDARIGNMMFPKSETEGRFVFIDWQAVRKGVGVYDLAYFLVLSLAPEHRAQVEKQCLESYHRHLTAKGVIDYSFTKMMQDYQHACLCVLVLLSLPFLSGEASAEGDGAKIFAWGMGVWRDRLQAKFKEFDYNWMADNYQLSEPQSRETVNEMLNVISERLIEIEKL